MTTKRIKSNPVKTRLYIAVTCHKFNGSARIQACTKTTGCSCNTHLTYSVDYYNRRTGDISCLKLPFVAIYNTCIKRETAIREIQDSGIDMMKLSFLGRDYRAKYSLHATNSNLLICSMSLLNSEVSKKFIYLLALY